MLKICIIFAYITKKIRCLLKLNVTINSLLFLVFRTITRTMQYLLIVKKNEYKHSNCTEQAKKQGRILWYNVLKSKKENVNTR